MYYKCLYQYGIDIIIVGGNSHKRYGLYDSSTMQATYHHVEPLINIYSSMLKTDYYVFAGLTFLLYFLPM